MHPFFIVANPHIYKIGFAGICYFCDRYPKIYTRYLVKLSGVR